MTKIEVAKVVALLMASYPSVKFSDATSAVYEAMLEDMDAATCMNAVTGLIRTSRFVPTIAEIREACVHVQHGSRRAGGEAWGDVVTAMKRYGQRRTPGVDFKFDDPLVACATAALGWSEFCLSENVVADRARFIELYDHLEGGARVDAQRAAGGASAELLRAGAPMGIARLVGRIAPTTDDVDGDDRSEVLAELRRARAILDGDEES